jgi:hypothetical protein
MNKYLFSVKTLRKAGKSDVIVNGTHENISEPKTGL